MRLFELDVKNNDPKAGSFLALGREQSQIEDDGTEQEREDEAYFNAPVRHNTTDPTPLYCRFTVNEGKPNKGAESRNQHHFEQHDSDLEQSHAQMFDQFAYPKTSGMTIG